MTDELTPEEKEALRKLPRERMPSAGLEGRVVGALRERGVLSKQRRRTVEITTGRVAGLIAASIALMIGAYSIGLHWSGRPELPGMATLEAPLGEDRATGKPVTPKTRADAPAREATDQVASEADEVRAMDASEAKKEGRNEAPSPEPSTGAVADEEDAVELKAQRAPESLAKGDDKTEEEAQAAGAADKDLASRRVVETERPEETTANEPAARQRKSAAKPSAPQATMNESAQPAQPRPAESSRAQVESDAFSDAESGRTGQPSLSFAQTVSFILSGTPVVIDAPDSVRIVQDEFGRAIMIYTKEGAIRIRLADHE